MTPPTVADVERIAALPDPVIRNLQITQCYHELSAALAERTGPAANWCTFATWASKQAGQTIRKEDLMRLFERQLRRSPAAVEASAEVAAAVRIQPGAPTVIPQNLILQGGFFNAAIDRASEAVARGNRKVFEEIAFAFARFFAACFSAGDLDPNQLTAYCDAFHPGDPPEGQEYLRRAFRHYAAALAERDPTARAQRILLANIEIGFHEQTRLQPEIAESLDAGWLSFHAFARAFFAALFPAGGVVQLAHLYLRRLLRRPTPLDLALQSLFDEARVTLRRVITGAMMTIRLPDEVLRLGDDLSAAFPETLRQITDPELRQFLTERDRTPDSPTGTGAVDWADLPDRLHFIIDFFRCYQEHPALFDPPFTPDQVEAIQSGRLPSGIL